jgi:GTP-binding protein
MFVDFVRIYVRAGNGGSGCVSFYRAKYIDKGGPDGGTGGGGGSIILRGNKQLRTLRDYTYRREYKANRGQHGMGSNWDGKSGEDILLEVPLGTLIRDADSGQILGDITEEGQILTVAKGGRGGRGNACFATSTHQAPREWEVGKAGEERNIELELKIIADIGLVGKPNAGKSTLLSRLTAAKPKIADYPFTTLEPNLGIVTHREYQSFVMADIPGLIEGASKGKGLGHQFLRHIERTRALVYLIDSSDENPAQTLKALKLELGRFSPMLLKKPAMVVLTKCDLWGDENPQIKLRTRLKVMPISAVSGWQLDQLKDRLFDLIETAGQQENDF